MGYAMHFPTNQLGGCKMLWGLRGYGLSEVWVKRGSTVYVELNVSKQHDNCRRETETRRQCDRRNGPITLSRSVVATHEGLSGVFRGSLIARSAGGSTFCTKYWTSDLS